MLRKFQVKGVGPASKRVNNRELADVVPGLGDPRKVVLYDDFLGSSLDGAWSGASGSDGSDPAIQDGEVGGVVRLATGGGTSGFSSNLSALAHGRNFRADNGEALVGGRLAIDTVAHSYIFIGFTDDTGAELPFTLDSDGNLTANASDAVGILMDTTYDQNFHAVGVAGDSTVSPVALGVGPADGEWIVPEVVVRETGAAVMHVDRGRVASLASAVSADVALTPVVVASDDNEGTRNLDVDWLLAVGER